MIKEEILEGWAKKYNVVLTHQHYIDFQRMLILKELKRINIDIDFTQYAGQTIDSQKFAYIISENIMRVFDLGEEDVGIMGMFKKHLESLEPEA